MIMEPWIYINPYICNFEFKNNIKNNNNNNNKHIDIKQVTVCLKVHRYSFSWPTKSRQPN